MFYVYEKFSIEFKNKEFYILYQKRKHFIKRFEEYKDYKLTFYEHINVLSLRYSNFYFFFKLEFSDAIIFNERLPLELCFYINSFIPLFKLIDEGDLILEYESLTNIYFKENNIKGSIKVKLVSKVSFRGYIKDEGSNDQDQYNNISKYKLIFKDEKDNNYLTYMIELKLEQWHETPYGSHCFDLGSSVQTYDKHSFFSLNGSNLNYIPSRVEESIYISKEDIFNIDEYPHETNKAYLIPVQTEFSEF